MNPRATHENPLVMRSSLAGDEHQGAEVPTGARTVQPPPRSASLFRVHHSPAAGRRDLLAAQRREPGPYRARLPQA